jgi:peroxiredoxin
MLIINLQNQKKGHAMRDLKQISLSLLILLFFTALIAKESAKKVDDFTLLDFHEKPYTLSNDKDSKAIVIMFIATRCPVSNAYNGRMVDLYKDYVPKGVSFVAINSNKQEDAEEVREHAEEHKFQFRVLKDPGNKVADAYDAQVTPEIYVVSTGLELLYHGRIDNAQREDKVESKDLRNALDELLSGKSVSVAETKAFGCSIKRVE